MKNRTMWWYVYGPSGRLIEESKSEGRAGAIAWWDRLGEADEEKFASISKRLGYTVRRVTVEWES
jgi:hypothetical protein